MTTFGGRLRQLRREAGLSQAELAGDGLSASYISLLEAGKRSPSTEVVHQLAARLGCSSTQLLEGRQSEREQRHQLELAYARLAIEHGESQDAETRLRQLLAEDGVPNRLRDEACLLLGMAMHRLGDYAGAARRLVPLFERSLSQDTHLSALEVCGILCRCYIDSGDMNAAVNTGERGLEAAQAQQLAGTDEYFRLAATIMGAYAALGDFMRARTRAEALIEEAERAGQGVGQAGLYWNSAILADMEGRLDEALRLSERALATMGELGNLREYARLRLAVSQILMAMDEPDVARAGSLLTSCIDDLRDHGSRSDLGVWNRMMSSVQLCQGDASGAEGRARQALDLLGGASAEKQAYAWLALKNALVAQGRHDEAAECLERAHEKALAARTGRPEASLWREIAEHYADAGLPQQSAAAFRNALDAGNVRDRSATLREVSRTLGARNRLSTPYHS